MEPWDVFCSNIFPFFSSLILKILNLSKDRRTRFSLYTCRQHSQNHLQVSTPSACQLCILPSSLGFRVFSQLLLKSCSLSPEKKKCVPHPQSHILYLFSSFYIQLKPLLGKCLWPRFLNFYTSPCIICITNCPWVHGSLRNTLRKTSRSLIPDMLTQWFQMYISYCQ